MATRGEGAAVTVLEAFQMKWTHELFGEFEYEGGWYQSGYATFDLEIEFRNDESLGLKAPAPEQVRLVLELCENHSELKAKAARALWEEFQGMGTDSGMWWRDDMELVRQNYLFAGKQPPETWRELEEDLTLSGLVSWHESDEQHPGLVELGFEASFESEHGIGVLTDGETVLGLGYCGEARPFGWHLEFEN